MCVFLIRGFEEKGRFRGVVIVMIKVGFVDIVINNKNEWIGLLVG